MRVKMKATMRKRKSASLTPDEQTSIREIIDALPTKADALDLLKVKTYNTIDNVYYKGTASPDLIKRVQSIIRKHAA
jgi:hypothetical protein